MPSTTFTYSNAVANELNAAAQEEGFANAKALVINLIRQVLIQRALRTASPQASNVLAVAEAAARAEASTIT